MNKKAIILIIIIAVTAMGGYAYKDILFLRNSASGVNDFNQQMLTRSIPFKKETPEAMIINLKDSLEKQKNIKIESVTYISSEQGIINFKERHPEVVLDKALQESLPSTIRPMLMIKLSSDNSGEESKKLREFVKTSEASPYTEAF